MTNATLANGTVATLVVAFALTACDQGLNRDVDAAPPSTTSPRGSLVPEAGFLYGRITTTNGAVHEGRLRWGGDEEALWSNYFNGVKTKNPWASLVSREQLTRDRTSLRFLGREVLGWDHLVDLSRPFMARFGDIARIEARGRDIQVILKSGTIVHLNRYSADDLADGVRVWGDDGRFVDIGENRIRTIEFLAAPLPNAAATPLFGTVRTRAGDFTGLIQWNRQACIGADALTGNSADGARNLRFDTIRSIARRGDGSLVTLIDGGEIVLSGAARQNSGIYVDDVRYGRVLISWDAFERVDFTPGASVPAYSDFEPGRPLAGDVVTRSGRRLSGRMVFDLDESETTETLDAPAQGIDYTIPFSLIASITPGGTVERDASVTLLSGEVLRLERWGDLNAWNGGILVFLEGRERPEYVAWAEVERVDIARPAEQHASAGPR